MSYRYIDPFHLATKKVVGVPIPLMMAPTFVRFPPLSTKLERNAFNALAQLFDTLFSLAFLG
ncbi:hypothetical protein DYP60_00685 [Sphaerochaeta halotolerans]|uniref:Uncharacterized protein n=1 Tax=Sphaerochaeta halotolerans TaxID=2293840 RepID=A0A372MK17_9SPIR|nr:hypothetical protein DYP60_00685 [Sphaerochaeta halotolerans]